MTKYGKNCWRIFRPIRWRFFAQSSLGSVIADPLSNAAVKTMAKEGAMIAKSLGCDVSIDVDEAFSPTSSHKPSIVQDLERGRPLELDAMFTVPLEFGKMTGVSTPMLDLMVSLMVIRAKGAGLYGTLTGLRAHLSS